MSIQALDLASERKYISKSDKGKEPTVWYIGVLDTRIRKKIEDVGLEYEFDPNAPESAKAKSSLNIGKSELDLVAFGLKGFDNFLLPSGKKVQFKTDKRIEGNKQYHVLAEEIISIIPANIITELANEIKKVNVVSEKERKN